MVYIDADCDLENYGIMVKEYGDFCTTAGENYNVLVAVDLSKIAAVKTAFDTFVTTLADKTAAVAARDAAQHYFAKEPVAEEGEPYGNLLFLADDNGWDEKLAAWYGAH